MTYRLRKVRRRWFWAVLSAGSLACGMALAELDEIGRLLTLDGSVSTSLGGPNGGTLRGGVALPLQGPGFKFNPRRRPEARYGTVELVQALVQAAQAVAARFEGSELVVNDLGHAEGGPIEQHGSHQSGRDVDILFFLRGAQGEVLPSVGVPLDTQGQGWDFKDLAVPDDDVWVRLDVERTWAFIEALLMRDGEHVQRIFIAEHLRNMLLAHAEKVKAPAAARELFANVTCQPGAPHDDHMHVRFHCTPEDMAAGCMDSPPVYPWRLAALAKLGLKPVLHRRSAAQGRAAAKRTTSRAEARRRAGKLHPDVVRFLERREQWANPPRTGRPWCR
jgi:penicillin-insensitive murein endopeptidase